jgi:hypothetical protein
MAQAAAITAAVSASPGEGICRWALISKEETMLFYRLLQAQTHPDFQEVPEPRPMTRRSPEGREQE